MTNHKQTEIEESLLPEITDLNDSDLARRKRIFIIIFVSFFIVMTAVVTTGVVYFVFNAKKAHNLSEVPTVILISLDGFRQDYLDVYKANTPNLNRLRAEGTYSPIHPNFATKTFPNHYSIVTGLYPESHGIISNTFYDPVFNATFSISDTTAVKDARWWGGEPLWVSVQKDELKSGIYFWPGSEAPIMGTYPTYYTPYDQSVPMNTRVDGVISWLEMPQRERPNFLALYMEAVDTAGHAYGPISDGVAAATAVIDEAIGRLRTYLDNSGKYNNTNLIIVSDHGMTLLDSSRIVFLDDCIDLTRVRVVDWSPNAFLLPNDLADTQDLMTNLTACRAEKYPNITAYLREEIPAPLFFNSSRRITPIVVIADVGWSITWHGGYNASVYNYTNKGNHGYDNRAPEMQGIFLAHGPNVKQGKLDMVPNLDVYNFITHILQVPPAPNNGTTFLVDNVYLA